MVALYDNFVYWIAYSSFKVDFGKIYLNGTNA